MPEVTEADIQKWYKTHESEFIDCPHAKARIRLEVCAKRQTPKTRFSFHGGSELPPIECQTCPERTRMNQEDPAAPWQRPAAKGNNHSGDAADKRWLARARDKGFKSESEMWNSLEKDFSTASAAKLWDVKQTTILYRWNKFGIKHPPGGANHCLPVVAICSKCKEPLECLGSLWKFKCKCKKGG